MLPFHDTQVFYLPRIVSAHEDNTFEDGRHDLNRKEKLLSFILSTCLQHQVHRQEQWCGDEDDNSSWSPKYEVRRYIQSLLQDASDPQTALPLFDVLHGTKHHKQFLI